MLYFNTEPRLKWNKIVLATKKFLISFQTWFRVEIILIFFNLIPEPPPLVTHPKTWVWIRVWNSYNNFIYTWNHGFNAMECYALYFDAAYCTHVILGQRTTQKQH